MRSQGEWDRPRPIGHRQLAQPPHGGYAHATTASGTAVDFIVDTIKAHPHQVPVFALGPATNIALAVKTNPENVPLVKQVGYLAGAFDVPGNQGPPTEFNVWFDPRRPGSRSPRRSPARSSYRWTSPTP